MRTLLGVAVAGALGALARYGLGSVISERYAYTTFSTLTLETYRLVEDGALGAAALNALGSLAVGLVAVWLGVSLGRAV
jgi:CrcB protein